MPLHDGAQPRSVRALHRRDARSGIGRCGTEVVERRAHIEFTTACLVNQAQVDGRATRVPRAGRYVAEPEQVTFVDLRVERLLAADIVRVPRPAHKLRHGPRGAIAIENLQPKTITGKLGLNCRKGVGGGACEQAAWSLVAGMGRPTKLLSLA